MSAWEESNNAYLGAELRWLRLRLRRSSGPGLSDTSSAPDRRPASGRRRTAAAGDGDGATTTLVAGEHELLTADRERAEAAEFQPPPALRTLAARFGLSPFERDVLLMCVGMDLDPGLAELYAAAQGDPRLGYPTFAVALRALPEPSWEALSPHRPLRHARLLETVRSPGQSLVSAVLAADERIVNYVKGLNELDARLAGMVRPTRLAEGPPLPESQVTAAKLVLRRWATADSTQPPPVPQLLGGHEASKLRVAEHIASALGLALYRMPISLLPGELTELDELARLWSRESALLGAALYLEEDDSAMAAGDIARRVTQFTAFEDGFVLIGAAEPLSGLDRPAFIVDVAAPTESERAVAWRTELGDVGEPELRGLAGHFRLDTTAIHQLAGAARADAGRPSELSATAWKLCVGHTRPRLGGLALRIEPQARWDDLVLPARERSVLLTLAHQVPQRARVLGEWGFGARLSTGLGVTALFAGPSGTGKTMAAEVLANELRLDLFKIDLSQVVSKYIGETEKNLRRLFDVAEDGGVVLLFDEADALFGKRTEVSDSHDRYANIEINYLLQRMERYTGLALLATNMKGALDTAFTRRLRFIIDFPFPAARERELIWRKVLPPEAPVAELDLEHLARLPLSGGMIRNVALNGAFAAAHADSAVTMPALLEAAALELRKAELPIPQRDLQWHPKALSS